MFNKKIPKFQNPFKPLTLSSTSLNPYNPNIKNLTGLKIPSTTNPLDTTKKSKNLFGSLDFGKSNLIPGISQTLNTFSDVIQTKDPSLVNSIGNVASSAISQINPAAGLVNSAGNLASSALFGEKSNPSDTGGQLINQASNVASMFGPIGAGVGTAMKLAVGALSTKIKGNTMDDRTGSSTGFTGTLSNNREDSVKLFGAGSEKNKVAQQQKKLNSISDLLRKSDLNFAAMQSYTPQNTQIDYTKGFKFGKEGLKLPNKKEVLSIKSILQKRDLLNKFKEGGSINVIPDGKLHAHNHNLELEVSKKGIPVIAYDKDGGVIQTAEIEKEEIIFNKEVTNKLEELKKDGSEKAMIEAGKLLSKEIMENTVDNTKKLLTDEN